MSVPPPRRSPDPNAPLSLSISTVSTASHARLGGSSTMTVSSPAPAHSPPPPPPPPNSPSSSSTGLLLGNAMPPPPPRVASSGNTPPATLTLPLSPSPAISSPSPPFSLSAKPISPSPTIAGSGSSPIPVSSIGSGMRPQLAIRPFLTSPHHHHHHHPQRIMFANPATASSSPRVRTFSVSPTTGAISGLSATTNPTLPIPGRSPRLSSLSSSSPSSSPLLSSSLSSSKSPSSTTPPSSGSPRQEPSLAAVSSPSPGITSTTSPSTISKTGTVNSSIPVSTATTTSRITSATSASMGTTHVIVTSPDFPATSFSAPSLSDSTSTATVSRTETMRSSSSRVASLFSISTVSTLAEYALPIPASTSSISLSQLVRSFSSSSSSSSSPSSFSLLSSSLSTLSSSSPCDGSLIVDAVPSHIWRVDAHQSTTIRQFVEDILRAEPSVPPSVQRLEWQFLHERSDLGIANNDATQPSFLRASLCSSSSSTSSSSLSTTGLLDPMTQKYRWMLPNVTTLITPVWNVMAWFTMFSPFWMGQLTTLDLSIPTPSMTGAFLTPPVYGAGRPLAMFNCDDSDTVIRCVELLLPFMRVTDERTKKPTDRNLDWVGLCRLALGMTPRLRHFRCAMDLPLRWTRTYYEQRTRLPPIPSGSLASILMFPKSVCTTLLSLDLSYGYSHQSAMMQHKMRESAYAALWASFHKPGPESASFHRNDPPLLHWGTFCQCLSQLVVLRRLCLNMCAIGMDHAWLATETDSNDDGGETREEKGGDRCRDGSIVAMDEREDGATSNSIPKYEETFAFPPMPTVTTLSLRGNRCTGPAMLLRLLGSFPAVTELYPPMTFAHDWVSMDTRRLCVLDLSMCLGFGTAMETGAQVRVEQTLGRMLAHPDSRLRLLILPESLPVRWFCYLVRMVCNVALGATRRKPVETLSLQRLDPGNIAEVHGLLIHCTKAEHLATPRFQIDGRILDALSEYSKAAGICLVHQDVRDDYAGYRWDSDD